MSSAKLIKKSKELEILCKEFAALYSKLITKFKIYAKAPEIEILETYWELAVNAIGLQSTIGEMIDYFIRYQTLILEARIDEIFSTDFTREIKPGTNPKTVSLIKKLIEIFKECWLKAETKDKSLIQFYVQSMTSKAILIDSVSTDIENMD